MNNNTTANLLADTMPAPPPQELNAGLEKVSQQGPDQEHEETRGNTDRSLATTIKEVAPWPEPVPGGPLLDDLSKYVARLVVLPPWAADTLALWCLHTYAFELRDVSAYIGLESPEKRCGKTTLLNALSRVVRRPVAAANISPSAFFRVIEETRPTLLIDEADTFLRGNSELRGIMNAGYHRESAYVLRVFCARSADAGKGDEHQIEPGGARLGRFSCWCPKLICLIGRLPDTLADRCIVIRLQRKLGEETCERLGRALNEAGDLRRKCARFVADHSMAIAAAKPAMPQELHDRAVDVWEPLLCLADLAGDSWPQRARDAALGLTKISVENCPIGHLLMDTCVLFVEQKLERLFSRDLVAHMDRHRNRPWMEALRGKPVTEAWLAKQLRPYGIRSSTMRLGDRVGRGYLAADFADALRRYVPKTEAKAMLADATVPPPPEE